MDTNIIEELQKFLLDKDIQKSLIDYNYKHPSPFHLFDKNFLIDFDLLLERLKIEYPELEIQRTEVEEYIENGFFPDLYLEDGKRGFMIHAPGRIEFIKEIIDKWGYNKHEIKKMTEYEDAVINDVLTSGELDYSDLPSLPFLIKYIKHMIDENKIILRNKLPLNTKIIIERQLKKYRKQLKFFENKEFKDLPLETQKSINDAVFEINLNLESTRLMMVLDMRARALLGFSPHAHINMTQWTTLDYDGNDYREYAYNYNYFDRKWSYGKWKYDPKWINPYDVFFATPEFYIGHGKDNSINISIRDTRKVDSHYLRKIEKYYNSFRQCLNIPKKEWGEKSGRKKMLAKRNKLLKETYQKLKEQKPNLAAKRIIEKAIDQISTEYDPISHERAERIIYSKK